jgi:hypothetical protein
MPQTQALIALLQAQIFETTYKWTTGQLSAPVDSGTLQLNAESIGRTGAFDFVLQMMEALRGTSTDD